MYPDENDPVSVFPSELGSDLGGRCGKCHKSVSLGEREFGTFDHVYLGRFGIDHVLLPDRLDDFRYGFRLADSGDPPSQSLQEGRIRDDCRTAAVGCDDGTVDLMVEECGTQRLRYPEVQEVPHHDLAVVGAHTEVVYAILDVLPYRLLGDLSHPPSRCEEGTVLDAGCRDLDDLTVLYHDPAEAQTFHDMSAHRGSLPGFHRDGFYDDVLLRPVVVVSEGVAYLVHDVHSVDDGSEHGVGVGCGAVLLVQVCVVDHVDEELGASRVGAPGVRHGDGSAYVRVTLSELVLDGVSGTAHTGAVRIPSLDHEVLDHPVEDDAVVESLFGEFDEVAGGDGHVVMHLQGDVPHVGVEGDGAAGAFHIAVIGNHGFLEGGLVEDFHRFYDDGCDGFVVPAGLDVSDPVHDVHSVDHFSEHRVCGGGAGIVDVKEGVVHEIDEELGASGVGAGVGHGDGPADVGVSFPELVLDLVAGTSGTVALRIPSLDHETVDDPVEGESVVESLFGEFDEVACGDGHVVVHQKCDVAHVRMHLYFGHDM